jgi:hypothetical protein
MNSKESKTSGGVQSTLDGVVEKQSQVKAYTREEATHAIAQLVACDDQVRVIVVFCAHIDVD